MSYEDEDEKSETAIEELAARTLRPLSRLNCEDLIATELATAILSEPLSKIRHVGEALMLLDEPERKQADITDDEVRLAEKHYKLATMFQNVFIDKVFDPGLRLVVERSATIQWPFPISEAKEWEEYICPPGVEIRIVEELSEHEKKENVSERRFFNTQGVKLMIDSVNALKTHFTIKAMPFSVVLMKKIIRLVSPDSYRQALQILRSGKHGAP